MLVGNKVDLPLSERQVGTEEGESLAKELGIPFVETSALNGNNVEAAFVCMTANIKKSVDRRGLTGVKQVTFNNNTTTATNPNLIFYLQYILNLTILIKRRTLSAQGG